MYPNLGKQNPDPVGRLNFLVMDRKCGVMNVSKIVSVVMNGLAK